jgi:hypothetical protein
MALSRAGVVGQLRLTKLENDLVRWLFDLLQWQTQHYQIEGLGHKASNDSNPG